jgi:hypothetical protein
VRSGQTRSWQRSFPLHLSTALYERPLFGSCYDQFFAGHGENKQAFKEGMYDPYRNGFVRNIDGLVARGFDRRLLKTMGTDEREQYLYARVYIRPGNQTYLKLPIEVKPRSTNDGAEAMASTNGALSLPNTTPAITKAMNGQAMPKLSNTTPHASNQAATERSADTTGGAGQKTAKGPHAAAVVGAAGKSWGGVGRPDETGTEVAQIADRDRTPSNNDSRHQVAVPKQGSKRMAPEEYASAGFAPKRYAAWSVTIFWSWPQYRQKTDAPRNATPHRDQLASSVEAVTGREEAPIQQGDPAQEGLPEKQSDAIKVSNSVSTKSIALAADLVSSFLKAHFTGTLSEDDFSDEWEQMCTEDKICLFVHLTTVVGMNGPFRIAMAENGGWSRVGRMELVLVRLGVTAGDRAAIKRLSEL